MNERITRFEHLGKTIVYVDYSDLKAPETIELTHQIGPAVIGMTELRMLINSTNSRGSPESMAAMKEVIAQAARGASGGSTVLAKVATFGLGLLGNILFDGLGRVALIPMRAFLTRGEALAWLVE